jgi:cyclopentanol dehydrogenase
MSTLIAPKPRIGRERLNAYCKCLGDSTSLSTNAGVHGRLGLEETSEEEWHRVLDHDLKTAWLGMKHCIPVMRRFGGGAIVNTSSVYGLIGSGKATAYHAQKAASS